jgi:4-hydroxy-tetrahydrodipicolinate reductase
VVGTTGWYEHLAALRSLAEEHGASLLYGTNFSVGVQAFFRAARVLAASLPAYSFSIRETHHVAKKDAPSGTALTLQKIVVEALPPGAEVSVASTREGDVPGLHVFEARSANDLITLQHDAFSRRGFAEGAVRAAEWIAQQQPGVRDFSEISANL